MLLFPGANQSREVSMNRHLSLSLLPAVSIVLFASPSIAGESPYKPGGTTNYPAPNQPKVPPEQHYSYYCEAMTLDGATTYRTDIKSERTPHDPTFINSVTEAWRGHVLEMLGKNKAIGQCYEGPTSTSRPAWEQAWKQQAQYSKAPVHVDWDSI
jgi:hypothetical protein